MTDENLCKSVGRLAPGPGIRHQTFRFRVWGLGLEFGARGLGLGFRV